ncbi:MAG: hypothetical protein LBB50_06270 [Oscillospiraceae bacterium]|nr:hypothetical protein [Oscillospiraceae bacterium]
MVLVVGFVVVVVALVVGFVDVVVALVVGFVVVVVGFVDVVVGFVDVDVVVGAVGAGGFHQGKMVDASAVACARVVDVSGKTKPAAVLAAVWLVRTGPVNVGGAQTLLVGSVDAGETLLTGSVDAGVAGSCEDAPLCVAAAGSTSTRSSDAQPPSSSVNHSSKPIIRFIACPHPQMLEYARPLRR